MTSDETIVCRWSIESRTRLSFAGDPPVQINKKTGNSRKCVDLFNSRDSVSYLPFMRFLCCCSYYSEKQKLLHYFII